MRRRTLAVLLVLAFLTFVVCPLVLNALSAGR
jgi:hypothetical protein